MAKKRNSRIIFDNIEHIATLYRELILFCENDNDIIPHFDMRRKPFRDLKTKYKFKFSNTLRGLTYDLVEQNVFYSNTPMNPNDWFKHLRNSFAHNRIFLDKKYGIIIQDIYRGNLSMFARVDSMELLIQFITAVKSIKLKQ